MGEPLTAAAAVAVWDAVLASVRGVLRAAGSREVLTPVLVDENAIEPFIDPLAAGRQFLRTSPELWHKRLLARRSGPIFEVAAVGRGHEYGALHRPGFHLLEWYWPADDPSRLLHDVEALVAAAGAAAAEVLGEAPASATAFETVGWLDAVQATTGIALAGSEDAEGLRSRVRTTRPSLWVDPPASDDPEVATVAAWTSFFSSVSDVALGPWLARRRVHLVEFPRPLAALATVGPSRDTARGSVAHRFESYVDGVELCNGYRELRDANEQRRRFAAVNGLRRALGQPPLALPEAFLAALPSMPNAVGAALGLERLVMLACARTSLAEILPSG